MAKVPKTNFGEFQKRGSRIEVSRKHDFNFPAAPSSLSLKSPAKIQSANLFETRPSVLLFCKLRNFTSKGRVASNSHMLCFT